MGYQFDQSSIDRLFADLGSDYILYGPTRMKGDGRFSDTDTIRYGEITKAEELVFDQKADYSFKEVLLPLSQTLFYFTEEQIKEADAPKKGAIVFLRSCDLHGVKRLDELYLQNGAEDYYYQRIRERVKLVLMGCQESFENCFCVSMGTERSDNYDASIEKKGAAYEMDNRVTQWEGYFREHCDERKQVTPSHVTENPVKVTIPDDLTQDVAKASMWKEYDSRCINCGRCNFVCPTCTCFTMQDIFYTDNGRVGERRRVSCSCMVDGYTDVAGGGAYRKTMGERMRFKVLHKVYDYKKRFGYHMCVGCGRCDDICPEYISFSNCINKLADGMKEVEEK